MIGDTTFTGNVHASGGYFRSVDGNDWVRLYCNNASSYSEVIWGDDTNDRLRFYFDYWDGTAQDREVMSLLANGRVGIGTSSPATSLDVRGGFICTRDNDGYAPAIMQGANGAAYFGAAGTSRICIGNSTDWERITVLDNGNVGIGDDTPSEKLEVSGSVKADTLKGSTVKVGSYGVIREMSSPSRVEVASNFAVTLDTYLSGNAEVTGDVTCDTVRCNGVVMNGWTLDAPDYVFEPGYKLRPISELEQHVKQHKHLPDVPSAAQIKQNGLDVAQMNMALLKKVEELTLYVIQQQKQISELKAQMDVR